MVHLAFGFDAMFGFDALSSLFFRAMMLASLRQPTGNEVRDRSLRASLLVLVHVGHQRHY